LEYKEMEAGVIEKERKRTNILVNEEKSYLPGIWTVLNPKGGKPGQEMGYFKKLLVNTVPILKALVIVTLFLLNGIGFSPLGCKTQYLMSSRFWYNKQVVIFFIIYFIINLGGYTISKLTDPIRQLVLSIICLVLFNITGRLGEVWFMKNPSFYPGPLTYFGVIAYPLVMLYIVDDMRRYMIATHDVSEKVKSIDALRGVEIGLISTISLILIVGFWKAIKESKIKFGKNFAFISFLFGAPMALKGKTKIDPGHCTNAVFKGFDKEVGNKNIASGKVGMSILVGMWGFIMVLIGGGIALFDKGMIAKKFVHLKNLYNNKDYALSL
jgi:hypothetical protein